MTPSRIDELTLEEKASLCLGSDFWHTAAVERLGIPAIMVSDGPHGLRAQPNRGDHAGVGGSLPATCFPTASALGSSWDPDLVRRVGAAIGREARAQGVAVVLGPGINIKRSPLCGRNFEYFSEDPLLSGVLGAALDRGLQSQGVGTSVKHFAANNQETDRLRVSADVDDRTLREIYLAGFERAVTQGRPWTVMCAYNKVNGMYASQHRWLLTEVLREEWGFDGLVVSDWGAVHDRVAALAAGLDLEMPPNLGVSDAAIVAAVRAGELDEAVLDTAVARVLQLVDRAAAGSAGSPPAELDVDAHHALARAAATECAVLLKNDRGLLPLRPSDGQTRRGGRRVRPDPALPGRRQLAGQPHPRRRRPWTSCAPRCRTGSRWPSRPGSASAPPSGDEELAAEAVALAGRADTVVAFLGLPAADESEGFDRAHMDLPANQTALLPRLAAANPNVVVVLANGSAVRVADWERHAPAILECWLSGQAAGGAAADLLLGAANPSGRLAETLPLRLEDNTSSLNFPGEQGHVRYGEGVFVGYRGYDALGHEVSYPFGHGLSYTTFDYTDLTTDVRGRRRGRRPRGTGRLHESPTPATAAARRSCSSTSATPKRRSPGPCASSRRSPRSISSRARPRSSSSRSTARDLSYWSIGHNDWVLEGGAFEIAVGASSRDLRLTATVDVPAPPVRIPLDATSTLQEWLADPDGHAILVKAVGTDETGKPNGIAGDAELIKVIGNFPLNRFPAFSGMGITHEIVRTVTEQLSSEYDVEGRTRVGPSVTAVTRPCATGGAARRRRPWAAGRG